MRTFVSMFLLAALLWQCQQPQKPPATSQAAVTVDPTDLVKMTHKEATDTLLADSTKPIQPLLMTPLGEDAVKELLANVDLGSILKVDYPDNGFYGADRYRIEFIFTELERTVNDPRVYAIKGKNKFKNTISNFEGLIEVKEMSEFFDPNLDTADIYDMNYQKMYTLGGEFKFKEDESLNTSGVFAGTFKMDLGILEDGSAQLWFFSENSPAVGCGYRFDGNWTSNKRSGSVKPVIWSRDLFRFANDILEDFSYGERDIEINEKYRHLGWDTFWSGEEWWTESPKKNM
ncbi:MAG: hypothetical protein ACKVT2_13725 [Saprospiraceae bacterium]